MGKTWVIEHMEHEDIDLSGGLPLWVILEYRQILRTTSSKDTVIISNLSKASADSLRHRLLHDPSASINDSPKLELLSEPFLEHLQKTRGSNSPFLERVCLLDPAGEKVVAPQDARDFDYFLFGGILGDDPPKDRTSSLRSQGYIRRSLGKEQMTTDTAVAVTFRVINNQVPLSSLPYVDRPEIPLASTDDEGGNIASSVTMPFKYLADPQGLPILPPGMKDVLLADTERDLGDMLGDDEQ